MTRRRGCRTPTYQPLPGGQNLGQRNLSRQKLDGRGPAGFLPPRTPILGALPNEVQVQDETGFPIANQQVGRKKQAQQTKGCIQVPVYKIPDTNAGSSQQCNHTDRQSTQPYRHARLPIEIKKLNPDRV